MKYLVDLCFSNGAIKKNKIIEGESFIDARKESFCCRYFTIQAKDKHGNPIKGFSKAYNCTKVLLKKRLR